MMRLFLIKLCQITYEWHETIIFLLLNNYNALREFQSISSDCTWRRYYLQMTCIIFYLTLIDNVMNEIERTRRQ